MRKVCLAYVDRADKSPLTPVYQSLRETCDVTLMRVGPEIMSYPPDILVLLGDKYQLLDACKWATVHKVPIAHIHGGECTLGS